MPQCSILRSLLFKIFFIIADSYDIASYVDDNTPYVSANIMDGVVESLEEASIKLFKRFNDNLMTGNANKCRLLVITNNTLNIRAENIATVGNF